MRVPSQVDQESYVGRALAIIEPPADQREDVRARLVRFFGPMGTKLQQRRSREKAEEKAASAAATKELKSYHQWLLAKQRHLAKHRRGSEEYVAALEAEIERVRQRRGKYRGHRPRDRVAQDAVVLAQGFLPPEQQTLTDGGRWHLLSMLFYEIITGEPNNAERVKYYMERMKSHGEIFRRPLLTAL
jgi:hypothetical protein